MKGVNLDNLADRLVAWAGSLWEMVDAERGGFRGGGPIGVNLMSSTDLAWILHAIGRDDVLGRWREPWVAFLRSRQDPQTGRFEYEPFARPQHSSGHALWHTVRALNILDADLRHFPHYLAGVVPIDGLRAFFDAVDWSSPASNHHEVLGLVPVLVNLAGAEWTELFYAKLLEQQDLQSGTWPRARPANISRTFAYTVLHRAAGRMPPMPERIVDAIISLQRPDGLWDDGPGFLTMDAAYLLTRLSPAIGHRQADSAAAMAKLRAAMDGVVRDRLEAILRNTHQTLAVVQTFSLLQEALGDERRSARPWRFDWDERRFYRSRTIAGGC